MNRILASRLVSFSKLPLLFSSTSFINHGRSCCQVSKIHPNFVEVPPNRSLRYAFSSCSASQDLTIKKCVPCNSKDIQPMSEQSAHELLPQVQGWTLSSEDGIMKLHRSWKVKSFTKGLEFFQLVADVAEAEGHHPDLHLVGWNNVKIDIWTHSVGMVGASLYPVNVSIDYLNLFVCVCGCVQVPSIDHLNLFVCVCACLSGLVQVPLWHSVSGQEGG